MTRRHMRSGRQLTQERRASAKIGSIVKKKNTFTVNITAIQIFGSLTNLKNGNGISFLK
jgi:hypothetical protein